VQWFTVFILESVRQAGLQIQQKVAWLTDIVLSARETRLEATFVTMITMLRFPLAFWAAPGKVLCV
jgi:hypothetical protein